MRIVKIAVLVVSCAASAAAQATQPLEASLRRGFDEPLFRINQPAYVAVFEVLPGQGVQQIFPRSGFQAQQIVEPGEYLLSRPFGSERGYQGWSRSRPYASPMYVIDLNGRVRSYYYATAWSGPAGLRPGRTILLVASRTPLRRVTSPQSADFWLQQVVGFRAISNTISAPEALLTDIVDAILPPGVNVDDVVVDVLEINTPDIHDVNSYVGRTISFSCMNGMYSVPADFFFDVGVFSCPDFRSSNQRAQTPASSQVIVDAGGTIAKPTEPPFIPGDPDGYKVPGRRRPAPTERTGLDQGGTNAIDGLGRSTITVGGVAPITYDGNTRGGVNPATGAWVPPTPSVSPGDYGWGAGRFSPAQGGGNRPTPEGSVSKSGAATSSGGAATPAATPVASPPPASPSSSGSITPRSPPKPIDP
jgi:hypothetical protein